MKLVEIDFVTADSTSHNLGVIEEVCAKLQIDKVPNTLVCHVHHMIMFKRKIKTVWQNIYDEQIQLKNIF